MIPASLEWLYFLLDKDGRSKYLLPDRTVSANPIPTPLVYTPDAWQDIAFALERDSKRHGLKRKFSFPLNFYLDGATIIRDTLYRLGQEEQLSLHITKRKVEVDDTTFKDYQSVFFHGDLEMASIVDGEDKLECKVGETGFAKKFYANEATKYEFPFSDPEADIIYMDGLPLHNKVNFSGISGFEYDDSLFAKLHIIAFGYNSQDGEAPGLSFHTQELQSVPGNTNFQTWLGAEDNTNYHIRDSQDTEPVTVTYSGLLKVKCNINNINASGVRFEMWSSKGTLLKQFPGSSGTPGMTVDIPIEYEGPIDADERFFIIGTVFGSFATGAVGFKYEFMEGSEVTINYKNRYKPSYVKGFQPWILLDKIIEKICGERNRSVSELLQSIDYRGLMLLSGDSLRALPDAVIKLSFNDFFEIYQPYTFAGCSIEKEKLVMEIIDRYYDPSDPIDLGDVSELKLSIATDKQGNTIKVGHKQKDPDEVNGKFAFNNTHIYSTKRESVTGEIKIVSPAIADPYTIESLRINLAGKTTTDSDGDNEWYVVLTEKKSVIDFFRTGTFVNLFGVTAAVVIFNGAVDADKFIYGFEFTVTGTTFNDRKFKTLGTLVQGANLMVFVDGPITDEEQVLGVRFTADRWELLRENYDSIEGVPNDQVFNVELITPKRLLMRWRRWLNSSFYKMAGTKMKYETTERNPLLKTVLNGVTIEEKADLDFTGEIMWKPYYLEFSTMVPLNFMELKEQSVNRCFRFTWNGYTFKGFDIRTGIAPDDNKPRVYKLLMSADTDETPLID